MSFLIGVDIGGTKIAAGVFTKDGDLIYQEIIETPQEYKLFIEDTTQLVQTLRNRVDGPCKIGMGIPGAIGYGYELMCCTNTQFLNGSNACEDLKQTLNSDIKFANDADCLALVEAIDGAGKGKRIVVGLIMGTGVGCGVIIDQKPLSGIHGLTGEVGHIPLPFYEEKYGEGDCASCGQTKCICTLMDSRSLKRLSDSMIGKKMDPLELADKARSGDKDALRVLDCYYDIVAKAMTVPIHAYDPDIIVVSGGLNDLPNMYEEVPKRWGKYCIAKRPKTCFVPAKHGPMAGMLGAAYL